ncbi:hypothetical protein JW905_05135, partial [bacterium]|nr:hypothetical protein [candidate division CSSED10-310 bacterium]
TAEEIRRKWEAVLDENQDHEEALERLSDLHRDADADERDRLAATLLRLAEQKQGQGDHREAAALAGRILILDRQHPDARRLLDKSMEALREEKRVIELEDLAEFHLRLEHYELALEIWRTVLSLTREDTGVRARIAMVETLLERHRLRSVTPDE